MTTPQNTSTRTSRPSKGKKQPLPTPLESLTPVADRPPSKLDQIGALLLAPAGATIVELVTATGWQQHSVRGAMAGALKKRGLAITSDKLEGVRRYRASSGA